MTTPAPAPARSRRRQASTPDSHRFPTRPYDLVKEFVIAMVVVTLLTVALAAVFSSPDEKPISLSGWAAGAPADVVTTATAELAGTSTSATYGAPYNAGSDGQKLGPLPLQRWAGKRIPVDSANDLVLTPLRQVSANPQLTAALAQWDHAPADQQSTWSNAYSDALTTAPDGDPAQVPPGSYGPVPVLAAQFLDLARTGGLEGMLTSSSSFYGGNATKPLLLLADGAFAEDQATAQHLAGDQWGMMNETGKYPGQPWMWLYTFWYQVKPFSSSGNADALVWGLMVVLSIGFVLTPFLPGVRSLPRRLGIYKLIWRDWYASHPPSSRA
jgi:hypothetical protein